MKVFTNSVPSLSTLLDSCLCLSHDISFFLSLLFYSFFWSRERVLTDQEPLFSWTREIGKVPRGRLPHGLSSIPSILDSLTLEQTLALVATIGKCPACSHLGGQVLGMVMKEGAWKGAAGVS